MALKKVYFGSVGPFVYDDAVPVNDPDGDFAGEDHKSMTTDGQLRVEQGPAADEEVIRLKDLGFRLMPPVSVVNIANPAELNSVSGDLGALVLAYQIVGAAGLNKYTLYAYDASGPAVNSPYVVDADGAGSERWIAIAGEYGSPANDVRVLKASELNDPTDPHLLTVDELKNTILTNVMSVGADEWDFPARTEGWNFIFIKEANQNITLDPHGAECWLFRSNDLPYVLKGAGVPIVNNSVGRSTITCFSTEIAVYCTGDAGWV